MTTTGVSTDSKNQIAIIYAQGEIQSGEEMSTL
jgi:protease-4